MRTCNCCDNLRVTSVAWLHAKSHTIGTAVSLDGYDIGTGLIYTSSSDGTSGWFAPPRPPTTSTWQDGVKLAVFLLGAAAVVIGILGSSPFSITFGVASILAALIITVLWQRDADSDLPEYEEARRTYQRLVYCDRCNHISDPSRGTSARPERIATLY